MLRESVPPVALPVAHAPGGGASRIQGPPAIFRARSADLARLLTAPRVELGSWPTPVERTAIASGAEILVKRDDLSGWGRGGAKARKLEHLIGHLVAHGYDELVTVAGNVTNLAFDLLPALERFGVASTLFIQDDPPAPPMDREEIFHDVRERVHLLGRGEARTLGAAFAAYARSRRRGRRPFALLPGVSHPAGVVGNACGFIEMAEQLRARGEPLPHTVFVTAATGTTVAGFLLGESALRHAGWDPIRVIGVQVYPGAIRHWTFGLIRWTERFLGLEHSVPRHRIEILTSCLHGGFGRYPAELSDLCERVEAQGGPSFDPIFGGKTWAAMESVLQQHSETERPALFWHCGYTPEWRALGTVVERGKAAR